MTIDGVFKITREAAIERAIRAVFLGKTERFRKQAHAALSR